MNLVQAAEFPFSSVGLPKTWASFGAQSFKIDAVFEMHRKNADAVVRATCVVLEGLNRMAKRQGELLAAAVGEQIKVAHDVLTHGSFGEKASNQVGAMRQLYVSNVSSFREQSDIAAETNIAVGDILSARAIEALDEYRVLFGEPSAASTASSTADAAVVPGHAARVEAAVVAEPTTGVDAAVVAEPAADVDAAVDAVPTTVVGEAPGANEAAVVEVAHVVSPAAKIRPKTGRRRTSRS